MTEAHLPKRRSQTELLSWFERVVIWFAQGLLVLLIAIAVFQMGYLVWVGLPQHLFGISDVPQLQRMVQRGFGGILLLILGLELLDTLRTYFTEHRVRLEVILIVATIALGRHVIQLDVEHIDAMQLLGISALTLALTTGYFLVKRCGVAGRS